MPTKFIQNLFGSQFNFTWSIWNIVETAEEQYQVIVWWQNYIPRCKYLFCAPFADSAVLSSNTSRFFKLSLYWKGRLYFSNSPTKIKNVYMVLMHIGPMWVNLCCLCTSTHMHFKNNSFKQIFKFLFRLKYK